MKKVVRLVNPVVGRLVNNLWKTNNPIIWSGFFFSICLKLTRIVKVMTVKIKCKDTTTPVYYSNVISHFTEGNTLALLFEDGSVRNFPMRHIWYYETKQPREKTETPTEQ